MASPRVGPEAGAGEVKLEFVQSRGDFKQESCGQFTSFQNNNG